MRIDWIQGRDWGDPGTWTVQPDYGFFHVYAFTMTLGMIVAVLLSLYRFWKNDLNLIHVAIGAAFIIPFGLFGGSVFGKLNAEGIGQNAGGVGFWGLFAFWEAGMSIHGAVYVGVLVGLIIFGIISSKTKVSIWVYLDCIVPNVLLAQAIGRFGNFFNHEVMGVPVWDLAGEGQNPLSWIANWILVNTQMVYNGTGGNINGIELINGHIYQMDPIFLYEVIGFVLGWLVLTFVVPNIGKWFGPKPWKRYPTIYKFNVGKSFVNMFQPWKWKQPYSETNQTWTGIWNSAYYLQKEKSQIEMFELKMDYYRHEEGLSKHKKQRGAVKALNKANNPDGYWVTKSGAEGAGYFFAWNIVRFFLELQRPDDHLFIMYEKNLSLALIMASAVIGLLFILLNQTILPRMSRQPGWVYEKEYFKSKKIKF